MKCGTSLHRNESGEGELTVNLTGKVAVITGGEGSLGREVTKRFLAEGVKVVLGWYALEAWEEAKGLIPSDYKGQFLDVRVDATKEEQVENLMKKAKDAFGSIDILLHMVGLFHAGGKIWETDAYALREIGGRKPENDFPLLQTCVENHVRKKTRDVSSFFPLKSSSALGHRLALMPCRKPGSQRSYLPCGKN